jgi:hypothetical protein
MENDTSSLFNKEEQSKQNKELNKEKKPKGYVRVFRNFIKRKENNRKQIMQNCFKNWEKQILKGQIIKKKVIVRISLSREKEPKIRCRNRFNMEKEEKERPESIKKVYKSIDKYKYPQKQINKKVNSQINSNDNKFNIAKKIKDYKGKDFNKENDKKNNIINKNANVIPENNKCIEINHQKPKPAQKKINTSDRITNLHPLNNFNNSFIEINCSKKKNDVKNKNNYEYKKVEPVKIITKLNTTYNKDIHENTNIIYISSTKKNKTKLPINNSNSNLKGKNNDNQQKDYSIKFEVYDGNNNDKKIKEYNSNESRKNRTYKKDAISSNDFAKENKNNYMAYKINTYQNPKNTKKNNTINRGNNKNKFIENKNKSQHTSKMDSNQKYSNLTAKPTTKGGVTTVIQHYSGRRNQYEQFDNKGSKK